MGKLMWKCLENNMKSQYGNCFWKVGEWKEMKGRIALCSRGYHASEFIIDAMKYVKPGKIALVEMDGRKINGKDKWVSSKMKVVEVYDWTVKDSMELALFSTELVIDVLEKEHPEEKGARKAVEFIKNYLKDYDHNKKLVATNDSREYFNEVWFDICLSNEYHFSKNLPVSLASYAVTACICAFLSMYSFPEVLPFYSFNAASLAIRVSEELPLYTFIPYEIQKWIEDRIIDGKEK